MLVKTISVPGADALQVVGQAVIQAVAVILAAGLAVIQDVIQDAIRVAAQVVVVIRVAAQVAAQVAVVIRVAAQATSMVAEATTDSVVEARKITIVSSLVGMMQMSVASMLNSAKAGDTARHLGTELTATPVGNLNFLLATIRLTL